MSACKNISIGNTKAHGKRNVKKTKTKFCDNTGKYCLSQETVLSETFRGRNDIQIGVDF